MIRLGVIGYGRRAQHLMEIIKAFDAGVAITALVDPRAEELRRTLADDLDGATVYGDVDVMLAEASLDGVLIGTRNPLHTPYAIKVLERKLPLFLEKPVAISWDQVVALAAAEAAATSPVVVSFPLRLSALCQTARQIIDVGVIGTVEQVQAVNNVPYGGAYYHGWMRDERESGNLWQEKATHDLDAILYLVGQPPVRVAAMESKTVFRGEMPAGLACVDCSLQDECLESPYNLYYRQGLTEGVEPNDWLCSFATDTGNHDSASAIIQFASGMHAVYSQNLYARRGAAARGITLLGYRGTIAFDWYRDELVVHHHHSPRTETHRFEANPNDHHGGDKELIHDFLGIMTGSAPSRSLLEAGLRSAQLGLLAGASCREGAFFDVPTLAQTAAGYRPPRIDGQRIDSPRS